MFGSATNNDVNSQNYGGYFRSSGGNGRGVFGFTNGINSYAVYGNTSGSNAIGAPGPNLYVAEKINGNQFRIAGGTPGMEVSWQVTGVRQDAYANANRIKVEEMKEPEARGKYLHPTAFGQPKEMGIRYGESMKRQKQNIEN